MTFKIILYFMKKKFKERDVEHKRKRGEERERSTQFGGWSIIGPSHMGMVGWVYAKIGWTFIKITELCNFGKNEFLVRYRRSYVLNRFLKSLQYEITDWFGVWVANSNWLCSI